MSPTPANARLMDATAVSRTLLADTAHRASRFTGETGRRPCLAAVLVGHDAASVTYVKMKQARCAPAKDVDGVTHSFATMAFGLPGPVACTPGGIIRLLDAYDVDVAGKHAVVIGRSPILGKPAVRGVLDQPGFTRLPRWRPGRYRSTLP